MSQPLGIGGSHSGGGFAGGSDGKESACNTGVVKCAHSCLTVWTAACQLPCPSPELEKGDFLPPNGTEQHSVPLFLNPGRLQATGLLERGFSA